MDNVAAVAIDACPTCGDRVIKVDSAARGESADYRAIPCRHLVAVTMHPDRIQLDSPALARWSWRDSRNGRRASLSCVPTREMAEQQLAAWRARDQRGGRPDMHESMPFVEVFRLI